MSYPVLAGTARYIELSAGRCRSVVWSVADRGCSVAHMSWGPPLLLPLLALEWAARTGIQDSGRFSVQLELD